MFHRICSQSLSLWSTVSATAPACFFMHVDQQRHLPERSKAQQWLSKTWQLRWRNRLTFDARLSAETGVRMKPLVWKINKVVAAVLAAFFLIYGTVVSCVVSSCWAVNVLRHAVHGLTVLRSSQIVPWLSFSVPGVTNLLILTITTTFALGSFVACVLADPGR